MKKEITGVMVYYYEVCKRKLWYFYNEIQMEQGNENVEIGKVLDEETYKRDKKHINIDNIINIDFIRSKGILHEVKKTKSIENAGIWQLKYYMFYLEQKGIKDIKAEIDFPLLREKKKIILEDGDRKVLKNVVKNIESIIKQDKPQKVIDSKICKKCSYYDICYV